MKNIFLNNMCIRIRKTGAIQLFILMSFITGCIPLKKHYSDSENMNLKGKIKNLKEYKYWANLENDSIRKMGNSFIIDPIHFYYFNNRGNILKDESYYGNGELNLKTIYKYNKFDKKIEEIVYTSKGEIDGISRFNYSKNVIEEKWSKEDSICHRYIYYLNNNKNVIEEKWFDSYDLLMEVFSYRYNVNGNQIEELEYNEDGSVFRKYIYEYNDKGYLSDEKWIESADSIVQRYFYKYKYDKFGNWIERIKYRCESPFEITERIIEYK